MTLLVTQQQRDNALEALHIMMPSILEEDVVTNLEHWNGGDLAKGIGCGTLACFGGFCASYLPFIEQGVCVESRGMPTMSTGVSSREVSSRVVSNILFGDTSMFNCRYNSYLDFDASGKIFKGTDHELICHRLRKLIKTSKIVGLTSNQTRW